MEFYIVRGVPGSGKTTFAKSICEKSIKAGLEARFFEADQYFYDSQGVYRFNRSEIGLAHNFCLENVKKALREKLDVVVVSNTSTTENEVKKYLDLAKDEGYTTYVITVENWHGNSNVHSVPEEVILKMRKNLKESQR